MKPFPILLLAALSGLAHASDPCDCSPFCGCGHEAPSAPISIMGDHLHPEGEWMISLRHMFMDMDGMYDGAHSVSPSQVHGANYIVSPTRMTMDMQMLGIMHAPSDDLTLMLMLPYIHTEMDHVIEGGTPMVGLNGGSTTFTTRAQGLGDLKLTALLRLKEDDDDHLHAGLGISLPTGSISERDRAPGPGGILSRQLPAAMQPGSGTLDLLPSLTYLHHGEIWSGGLQARGVIRTHENHHDYRLGNRFELDGWVSASPREWLSLHTGLGFKYEGELHGQQSDVLRNPPFAPARETVPTAFGRNYGGMRLEGLVGASVELAEGHALGLDLRLPLWQEVNGHRLGNDLAVTLGWQSSF